MRSYYVHYSVAHALPKNYLVAHARPKLLVLSLNYFFMIGFVISFDFNFYIREVRATMVILAGMLGTYLNIMVCLLSYHRLIIYFVVVLAILYHSLTI